jgi:DNA-directed RNA polymerase
MTVLEQQVALEQEMVLRSTDAIGALIAKAEERGRAHANPYGTSIFRDYVEAVSAALQTEIDLTKGRVGSGAAWLTAFQPLDPKAVAYIAVRNALNLCMANPSGVRRQVFIRHLAYKVYTECAMEHFGVVDNATFLMLNRKFIANLTKSESHKLKTLQNAAKKKGITLPIWTLNQREQVGLLLMLFLEQAGMLLIPKQKFFKEHRMVFLTEQVMTQADDIARYVAENAAVSGPCYAEPLPWRYEDGRPVGGWHTPAMQERFGLVVMHGYRPYPFEVPQSVLDSLNALQGTRWRINRPVLQAVRGVAAAFSTKEVVSMADKPAPTRPEILGTTEASQMSQAQRSALQSWKYAMRDWHTERKHLMEKFMALSLALRMAGRFQDAESIHFVYHLDSRGRAYPRTVGVNPQGTDLQKALLHFADGLPLDSKDAVRWFKIHGANKAGFDKGTFDERCAWVDDHADAIALYAENPVDNRGWADADKPLQFLAWCFEFAAWQRDPKSFVSHIPISMDGSCNGLQHLSALLRDATGGAATNLVPAERPKDIYQIVADAAWAKLANPVPEETDPRLRLMWRETGVDRGAAKRSVMTMPYGVTRHSAMGYVQADFLDKGKGPNFHITERNAAAKVLMHALWPAIGEVVVKGREAMVWLKAAGRQLAKGLKTDASISWELPNGFRALQWYPDYEMVKIHTKLYGVVQVKVAYTSALSVLEPNISQHANGLAPNFVHSLDACHLHSTVGAAMARGIKSFAMIHDDYGTHAANSEALYHVIREQFVRMYSGKSPLLAFQEAHPELPAVPEAGTLDVRQVLKSEFFFS